MIKTAIIGLGWWGKSLVESVKEDGGVIRFVAGTTRSLSDDAKAFAQEQGFKLHESYEAVLADPGVDAVVLATPHSLHSTQIIAAAAAGKHVFCEKPFALTKAEAEAAVAAMQSAGLTLGLGYNRRFHPMIKALRERIKSGGLGTILHVEGTMTFPNALSLPATQWRANKEETPCGGLTPMGVHIIDAMIDFCGEIDEVYCQSFRRVVPNDTDDTTSVLLRMKDGMSGYLGTITATGGSYRLQVYGSEGWVRLDGMAHIAGTSSLERRSQLFAGCTFQPIKGAQEVTQVDAHDVVRAELVSFAQAAEGGEPFPIPLAEMIHGAAVVEAIVRSAASGRAEKVA